MLENTEKLIQIDSNTYKEVGFLFIVFKAFTLNKVIVEGLMYRDEDSFIHQKDDGLVYIGEVDFN